jgi:hypothetical protein
LDKNLDVKIIFISLSHPLDNDIRPLAEIEVEQKVFIFIKSPKRLDGHQ